MLKRVFLVCISAFLFFGCQSGVSTPESSAKEITSFSFSTAENPALSNNLTGTIEGTAITVTAPYGTAVTALKASFTCTGASVTVNGTAQVSGKTENDFSSPLIYRVTAEDGSTKDYTVTLILGSSSAKEITSFGFSTADNPALANSLTGTIEGTAITVTAPYGTAVTALKASFTCTGTSISVNGTAQVSGKTVNDFTNPVTYRVTAGDGSTKDYTVTLTPGTSSSKEITSFSFSTTENPALSGSLTGTIKGTAIAVTAPYGTAVTALKASFSCTGTSIAVKGTAQVSGKTVNDFTNPVTYRVTAADGSTKDYTVTVTFGKNPAKEITSFSFSTADNPALSSSITGTIEGTAIAVTAPYGSVVTALKASFTCTGTSIAVNGTAQVSGETVNDFSSPVIYRVTAEDDSTKDYTVTVTVAKNPAKELTGFSLIKEGTKYDADTITDTLVMMKVPHGTSKSAMTVSFTITGASASINGTVLTNEITAADFTKAVTLRVTAEDGTYKDYMVRVNTTVTREQLITMINNNEDVTLVNTYGITDMRELFYTKTDFNQDIGYWDVSNVVAMDRMFCGAAAFNQDIGRWNVSKVTNMNNMFYGAKAFNQDISAWNVSKVYNMSYMFTGARAFNQPIGSWDVSSVTTMAYMFNQATAFNQPLNSWNVSKSATFQSMFCGAENFNQDLNNWDVSNALYINCMFDSALAFNGDISSWDVGNVISMQQIFYNAKVFNRDITGWNTAKVTNMESMFNQAAAFNQKIGDWETSNVTNMIGMFLKATSFNQPIDDWVVTNVTDMSHMFDRATAFNQDLPSWDVDNVTDMKYMFAEAKAFNGDIANWNVLKVTDMSFMFSDATAFNRNISGWSDHVASTITHTDFSAGSSTLESANHPYASWNE